jgi:hypothetical protein
MPATPLDILNQALRSLLEAQLELAAQLAAAGLMDRAALMRMERALTRGFDRADFAGAEPAQAWVQLVAAHMAALAARLPRPPAGPQ